MRSLQQMLSNTGMGLVLKVGIYAIECLFIFGIIGAALVVLLTSIEDFEVFLKENQESAATNQPKQPLAQNES